MNFTVNNHRWTLQFTRPHSEKLRRSDGSITLGMTDFNTHTVYIADNLSAYMTDKVLMHELAHAHALEYGYVVDLYTEEVICDFMSLYGRSIVYTADELLNDVMRRIA